MQAEREGHWFQKLVEVIARLRDPECGCPWDKEQTHHSLKKYLLEESYELFDAIDAGDLGAIEEELGDVLLQVLLHAQIGSESSGFSMESVSLKLREKLIERHPHVFGEQKLETADQVRRAWEKGKQRKKEDEAGKRSGTLAGLPRSLPALAAAHTIGEKVGSVNFDWNSSAEVLQKVREEFSELLEEDGHPRPDHLQAAASPRLREEFGDLLFTLAQYSRKLGFSAEDALREANAKFIDRFSKVELAASARAKVPSRDEMLQLWQRIKAGSRQSRD